MGVYRSAADEQGEVCGQVRLQRAFGGPPLPGGRAGEGVRKPAGTLRGGEAPAPAAAEQGALTCLVQVSLAEVATAYHAAEGARGGTSASELLELVERIENHEHLRCGGVMAVAPLGMNPDAAFEKLYGLLAGA